MQFSIPNEVVSATALIKGMEHCAQLAHQHRAKVFACTITPVYGVKDWTEELEHTRLEVNNWILNQQFYDGAFDFAAYVADPDEPRRIYGGCHIGDFIHINPAGGQAIAENILKHFIFIE